MATITIIADSIAEFVRVGSINHHNQQIMRRKKRKFKCLGGDLNGGIFHIFESPLQKRILLIPSNIAIREGVKKTGFIWDFVPNIGPHPPTAHIWDKALEKNEFFYNLWGLKAS